MYKQYHLLKPVDDCWHGCWILIRSNFEINKSPLSLSYDNCVEFTVLKKILQMKTSCISIILADQSLL